MLSSLLRPIILLVSSRLVSDSLAVFLFFAARTLPHEEEEEEEQRVAGAQVNSSFSANKKIRRWSDDGGGGYSLASFNEWNSGAGVENPVLQFRAYSDGHFRKHGRNL